MKMEFTPLNLIAACVMASDWGVKELSFIIHENGFMEMEGNYCPRSDSNLDWGIYPTEKDFEMAKMAWVKKGPWPFKPTVVYDHNRHIVFEAGY